MHPYKKLLCLQMAALLLALAVTLLAFQANRFFVLLGDRQMESLDDTIPLGADTAVAFVRVVPLVGA